MPHIIPYIIVPCKAYLSVVDRVRGDVLTELELFLGALLACLGAILFLTSLIAWKRTGSMKIGLISLALLVFTLKGIYLTYTALSAGWMAENTAMLVLDISVIALIYFSVLKG
jgi:hypothetical protein